MLLKLSDIIFDIPLVTLVDHSDCRKIVGPRFMSAYAYRELTTCASTKKYDCAYRNERGQSWQYKFIMRCV